jgi:hypothetical protein
MISSESVLAHRVSRNLGGDFTIKLLKAEDAQTPSFTHLFLMSTEGWDAGTPSLPSLSASQP